MKGFYEHDRNEIFLTFMAWTRWKILFFIFYILRKEHILIFECMHIYYECGQLHAVCLFCLLANQFPSSFTMMKRGPWKKPCMKHDVDKCIIKWGLALGGINMKRIISSWRYWDFDSPWILKAVIFWTQVLSNGLWLSCKWRRGGSKPPGR